MLWCGRKRRKKQLTERIIASQKVVSETLGGAQGEASAPEAQPPPPQPPPPSQLSPPPAQLPLPNLESTDDATPHHLAPGLPLTLPRSVSSLFLSEERTGEAAVPLPEKEREKSFFLEPPVDRAVSLIYRYVEREDAVLVLQAAWRLFVLSRTASRLRTLSVDAEAQANLFTQLASDMASGRLSPASAALSARESFDDGGSSPLPAAPAHPMHAGADDPVLCPAPPPAPIRSVFGAEPSAANAGVGMRTSTVRISMQAERETIEEAAAKVATAKAAAENAAAEEAAAQQAAADKHSQQPPAATCRDSAIVSFYANSAPSKEVVSAGGAAGGNGGSTTTTTSRNDGDGMAAPVPLQRLDSRDVGELSLHALEERAARKVEEVPIGVDGSNPASCCLYP